MLLEATEQARVVSQFGEVLSINRHGLERRPRSLTLGRRKPGWGRIRGDLLRPSLLFFPLIKPWCVRIGGDGHPGAPHRSAILPGQLREVFGAFRTKICPKATPGGALPPAVLLRAVEPCTPVIVVRPQPHHRAPDEQRHDAHGRHQRAYAESHRSHWHSPAMKPDSPRTPIDTT